jgi:hypothetical protein
VIIFVGLDMRGKGVGDGPFAWQDGVRGGVDCLNGGRGRFIYLFILACKRAWRSSSAAGIGPVTDRRVVMEFAWNVFGNEDRIFWGGSAKHVAGSICKDDERDGLDGPAQDDGEMDMLDHLVILKKISGFSNIRE